MNEIEAVLKLIDYHQEKIDLLREELEEIQKSGYKYEVIIPNYSKADSYGCTKYLFNDKEKAELFLKQGFGSDSNPEAFVDCVPYYEDGFSDEVKYDFDEAELKEIK